ncbi:MAG: TIGR02757 family protein [Bacteroidetes bacterium]|nr:TIGR02757 family protein [Bacteroidota bacterium]
MLEESYFKYNNKKFIADDPISIPHGFTQKEDIEISAFLAAAIAWGQRKTILVNAGKLMRYMDNAPYDFVINSTATDLLHFKKFVHRTFNGDDCVHFVKALKKIYLHHAGLEAVIKNAMQVNDHNLVNGISGLREIFFALKHLPRTQKHFANPLKNSSCKRINMFLRWMIRKDKAGVDFGLWNISPALLLCPLDVHTGRIARELGLLNRAQDDLKAVIELTNALKEFDKTDPVKYDFALFGLGIDKKAGQLLSKF